MRSYIAFIHKDADSDYGVSFPDLPGCVTAGATLDEARAFAEEALTLHLAGMVEDGEAIPEPSSLEAIMREAENRKNVVTLVSAREPTQKSVRINITMPEDMLNRIDDFAQQRGMNRSGFLVYAARKEMESA